MWARKWWVTSFSVRKVVVEAEPKWKKGHLPGKWAPFTDAQDTFPALFLFLPALSSSHHMTDRVSRGNIAGKLLEYG
jgi:hypothetical protein